MNRSKGRNQFMLNNENSECIELICQYLNNEVEFEKDGRSLSKGLYIYGNFGSGKTLLIKAYTEFKKHIFNQVVGFKTCQQMIDEYRSYDQYTEDIMRFESPGIKKFVSKFDNGCERVFDDLGAEQILIMDYGNKICVMEHILVERHKNFSNGVKTHLTSNLKPDGKNGIEEFYGGRLSSRIFENYNIIALGTKSDSIDHRKI